MDLSLLCWYSFRCVLITCTFIHSNQQCSYYYNNFIKNNVDRCQCFLVFFFLYFWISINMSLFFIKWFSYYNTVELKHIGQTIRIILGQIHRCWIKKNNVWIYRNLFELKKILNINIATTLNKLLLSFNRQLFWLYLLCLQKKTRPHTVYF